LECGAVFFLPRFNGYNNQQALISNPLQIKAAVPCAKLIDVEYQIPCAIYDADTSEQVSSTQAASLIGYSRRLPLENRDSVSYVNSAGKLKTTYTNSYQKKEVQVGLYSEIIHEAMERAAENGGITINSELLTLDTESIYQLAPIDNGLYTGRIEMVVEGSEKTTASCCCPVIAFDGDNCGELILLDITLGVGASGTYKLFYQLNGIATGTSIDVRFENLTEIDTDSPCNTPVNTEYIQTGQSDIGEFVNSTGAYVNFSSSQWDAVYDNEYCGVQNIQYAISIRVNCGETQGEWSNELIVVASNIPTE
jgi:hypothetical protein